LEIIAHCLTHASKTFIFVLSVHKLTIHCQVKTAEEITQIANMTPLKEIRIYEAIYLKCMRKYVSNKTKGS
jgi:hypothetical protein